MITMGSNKQVANWKIEPSKNLTKADHPHPDEPYPCDGLDRSVKATATANDGVRNLTLRQFGTMEKTRMLVAHQLFVFLLTVKPRKNDAESTAFGCHGFAFEASASSSSKNKGTKDAQNEVR
jgi:hypothetical protein